MKVNQEILNYLSNNLLVFNVFANPTIAPNVSQLANSNLLGA